jgi:hypothetical protein
MFGTLGRNARLPDFKLNEPPKQGGTEQVRQIGGFMAPWSRKNLPRSLQVIGATMRQIGNPEGGALDQFSANEAEQQARDMAMRAYEQRTMDAKQDRGRADEQRNMLEQVISQLPPDQQRLARLDPEGFVRALMARQGRGQEWENNGTQPYRIDENGNVIMGSGTIPHRPRQPLIGYMMPEDDGSQYTDELPEHLR